MKFKLVFDICDHNTLIKNFAEKYNLEGDTYDKIFEDYFKKNTEEEFSHFDFEKANKEVTSISLLEKNDIIVINYISYSQKYISDYPAIFGKVLYSNELCDNALVYIDKMRDGIMTRYIYSIDRDYCSYFGNFRGFDFYIYKYF